jgi:hypothetical protein
VSPSIAESTEIEGVMIPSPKSSPAPSIAKSAAMRCSGAFRVDRLRGTSESSAKMPPSPRLLARVINSRYFMLTTSVIAQKTSDRTP